MLDEHATGRARILANRIEVLAEHARIDRRHGEGARARMIRRICERMGRVTVPLLMRESGRTAMQCANALRNAAWRGRLVRVPGTKLVYVLPTAAKEEA